MVERLDDGARTERGRLDQGSVDVLRLGGQRLADDHSREFMIHQHRPVAAVPVQGQQPVLAYPCVAAFSVNSWCKLMPRELASAA